MGAFTDLVDPNAFKVLNPPDYIFLCGGSLTDKVHSLRGQFYDTKVAPDPNLIRKVKLAETADRWYRSQAVFEDLLELEEHLAGLSACILLFVESPGAIAEFGAFSQMSLLREKLLVVVERSHFLAQSFIRHGPIEQMKRSRPESILSYPWLADPSGTDPRAIDPANLGDTLDEIEKALQAELSKRPKSVGFLSEDHGHRMLLIADLIKLNVVSTQRDIQDLLDALMVSVKGQGLNKYLYLLEQLGIIVREPYGNGTFYFSARGVPDYIYYAPKTATDRPRLRSTLRKDFPFNLQKKRVLDAFTRRTAMVTP